MLLVPLDTFGSAKVAQSFRHTGLEIIVALSNIKYFRKDFISTGYVTTIQNRKEVTGLFEVPNPKIMQVEKWRLWH